VIKRIALLLLIFAPYLIVVKMSLDFISHYHYLTILYFNSMEASYAKGCLESGCVDPNICHVKGREQAESLKKALEPLETIK
jgi:hypothetical protein